MHSIIIVFLTNTSSRKAISEQNMAVTGLLLLPVSKADRKTFYPMSRIRPVTARPAPQR